MKKKQSWIIAVLVTLILLISNAFNDSNIYKEVKYTKGIDGDSFYLSIDGKVTECRLLVVDTPEMKTNDKYAKEAYEFTDGLLKNAKELKVEIEKDYDNYDKYGRLLIWLFVDGDLLQTKLLEEGLAKIRYIDGDYEYLNRLYKAENKAKESKLNLWS